MCGIEAKVLEIEKRFKHDRVFAPLRVEGAVWSQTVLSSTRTQSAAMH
jgi:hypothetical protein